MPIYEYECQACGKQFEALHRSMFDSQSPACPACGAGAVQRRLSVFASRSATTAPSAPDGACQRCGDPNGPCSW
jgi:putative FmdB family regulatory protein